MRFFHKIYIRAIFILIAHTGFVLFLRAQAFELGWSGEVLVPSSVFNNPSGWTVNVPNPELGDAGGVTFRGDTLTLEWVFGTGNRYKWVQCYLFFEEAISLEDYDLFGFSFRGMPGDGVVGFELKFEDGTHQAVVRWDGLAGLERWAGHISAYKKQFENAMALDWSRVHVVSFAVYAKASSQYTASDEGSISICHLEGATMSDWERATEREFIDPASYVTVKENAFLALIDRQQPTGLLETWVEDGSSWLYGQGLALKALSIEGTWNNGIPANEAAESAEKLALFLATHQQPEGYWPRAWDAATGNIRVLREPDGTVWMGDFPWIITALQAYFKKSGDTRVEPAIRNGLDFLGEMIMPDGEFFTTNPETGQKYKVGSCEAYAAAMLCLEESGDTVRASKLFNYISEYGWDAQNNFWREATMSDRIVLFANTWMSYYLFSKGEIQRGLDALTIAGKVMYTEGDGTSFGLDGIVPLAVWNEGVLSYIADGGPGSIRLFEELAEHIHPDGMVSHYNEDLGVVGGIWAVDWHSLDGTSWLYFVALGNSPFDVLDGDPAEVAAGPEITHGKNFIVTLLPDGYLIIRPRQSFPRDYEIRIITMDGKIVKIHRVSAHTGETRLDLSSGRIPSGVLLVQIISSELMECYRLIMP